MENALKINNPNFELYYALMDDVEYYAYLLDSNKRYLEKLLHKETITKLESAESVEEIADIAFFRIDHAHTDICILHEIHFGEEPESEEQALEWFYDNDFSNQIGDLYFYVKE